MASQVEICNLALTHIGQKRIQAISDANQYAQTCNALWSVSFKAVLETYAWSFATRIIALALLSGETVPDWTYLYQLPTGCLTIQKIYNADTVDDADPPEYEEIISPSTGVKVIGTDIAGAYARYTQAIADVTLCSNKFALALSYHLASGLAVPLGGKESLAQSMLGIYSIKLEEAKYADSLQQYKKDQAQSSSSFIDAR